MYALVTTNGKRFLCDPKRIDLAISYTKDPLGAHLFSNQTEAMHVAAYADEIHDEQLVAINTDNDHRFFPPEDIIDENLPIR